ncbi:MAG: Cysteine desulfurase [Microgenomates group bacterium GW2011_GWF2_45_18]|nr:MAG: Cysteine desulfurase [Microgenomates group bacterium GW2011_GWF1_44_10]KKU02141.1 MAG: Cysteine desulfurase [Microgenomates group bacterium GW2011_GWF2_45_18]OGJ41782.1 MAG: hypothetical protein A2378_00690 [Candidatus Pacebacteria bacterium RIFOXYB1_FULL_44_10]HAU98691.1 cysteine desulfurase [Candidatus Paceibacterota bacterium]HAX01883.1 cysteine desulfurase [Candidatus Paceibacterota bacterium]
MNTQLQNCRADFPILSREIHDQKPLVYLDSAATSQKPKVVLDAIQEYYQLHNANVHRGIHVLGDESTHIFHESRQRIAQFFGATENQLILTRNTTEALNLIAWGWALDHLSEKDVVITTEMEHHSNFVPWQEVCKRTGAKFEVVSVTQEGLLDLQDLSLKLHRKDGLRVKLVAVVHVSNAIGTRNPVELIAKMAHEVGAMVVIDGAQSAPHLPISFPSLGADVFAFSGHKMLGPMGIGGMIVSQHMLEQMNPVLFGGGMIDEVTTDLTTYADLPDRFIAGTPDVAGAVGLAKACAYLTHLNMNDVEQYDRELVVYTLEKISAVEHVKILGSLDSNKRVGSVAFLLDGVHAHDVAQVLDSEGVAVRSGHHCTMPLHRKFAWAASTRASFSVYSTKTDVDVLVSGLEKVKSVFNLG